MSIIDNIEKDKTAALKERSELKLSVLRMLATSLKNASIAKKGELSDEEALKILKTELKHRQEAAEAFAKGNKDELAAKEKKEAEIIQEYLPAQLSDDELEQLVTEALTKSDITEVSKFGQAMAVAMKAVQGKADGNRVQVIVKKILK